MGDSNGIEIARDLQERNPNTVIIFVTSHRGYLDAAMDIKAARFIDKPVVKERVFSALDRAAFEMENNQIFVHTKDSRIVAVKKSEVILAEARLRTTQIVSAQGAVIAREGIRQIKEMLHSSSFAVPHNSYVVNMNYIKIFRREELLMEANGKTYTVPVSTRRQAEFKKEYIRFIGEG